MICSINSLRNDSNIIDLFHFWEKISSILIISMIEQTLVSSQRDEKKKSIEELLLI